MLLEHYLLYIPTLQTSPPEQKESGSSARGLQSHLEGRHLHITHLKMIVMMIVMMMMMMMLTWCLLDTWRPHPPHHSRSRGHTLDTRSWSGHPGGWRHTPEMRVVINMGLDSILFVIGDVSLTKLLIGMGQSVIYGYIDDRVDQVIWSVDDT